MKLNLVRDILDEDFTLGKLYLGNLFLCYTVEDTVRDKKIHGKTAIPYGQYEVIITMSNRFKKKLPLLLDVPGFEGIRIHAGNNASHTEGCILPGFQRTEIGVAQSRDAMEHLQPMIQSALDRGDKVTIAITEYDEIV